MMTPSIWTAIYMDLPSQALRKLHACGWDCFELSTEHLNMINAAPDTDSLIEDVKATIAELGAEMPQAHCHLMANVAHPNEGAREADVGRIESEMSACARLGVRDVVIHPGRGRGPASGGELAAVRALNVEAFRRLGGLAGELGLRIGIENMMGPREGEMRRFGAAPKELTDMIDEIANPALGITLDTSHANVMGLDIPAAVREFGSRLHCTHISDNDGSGDQHRTPGGGKIDWPPIVAALAEAGYGGTLNLEIPGERHPVPEIVEMKLRHAREVAAWLANSGV